jgi:hypothetical protein
VTASDAGTGGKGAPGRGGLGWSRGTNTLFPPPAQHDSFGEYLTLSVGIAGEGEEVGYSRWSRRRSSFSAPTPNDYMLRYSYTQYQGAARYWSRALTVGCTVRYGSRLALL